MEGYQRLVLIFIALVLLCASSVVSSAEGLEKLGNFNEEENNIFSDVQFQSEPIVLQRKDEISSVYVSFSELAVSGNNDEYVKSILKSIGKNSTTIILNGEQFDMETLEMVTRQSVSMLFLDAVVEENEIRQLKGQDVLQILLHIPVKSVHDIEDFNKFAAVGAGFGMYMFGRGIISGIVLEATLIQNPVKFEVDGYSAFFTTTDVWTGVAYLNTMMKAMKIIFGHEFQLGLAVNSFVECGSTFLNVREEMFSQFDFILYNELPRIRLNSFYSRFESSVSDIYSNSCRDLFSEQTYYRVKQVL